MTETQARSLLEHGPFLRALATALLRDAARADDVVSEAWLAALRRGDEAPRSWLSAVVRNLARRSRRDEARRIRRERAAARPEYVRPAAEVAAAEESRRAVVKAVLALREPYRTTLLLRFYDGLAPAAIARRLRIEPSTVRSRIQRGLKELRGALDGRDGRRAWCLALLPLATSRSSLVLGALAMKMKLAILAAVAGCALLAWQLVPARENERASPAAAAPAAAGPHRPPDHGVSTDPGHDPSAVAPGEAALEVTGVASLDDGRTGETVQLEIEPSVDGDARPVAATAASGRPFRIDATALCDPAPPLAVRVTARLPGHVAATARRVVDLDPRTGRPLPVRVDLVLRRAGLVRGRVADAGGGPLHDARVAVFPLVDGRPDPDAAALANAGETGAFELSLDRDGTYLVAAFAAGYRPAGSVAEIRAGTTETLAPFALAPGADIAGRVTVAGGGAAPGVAVRVRSRGAGTVLHVPREPGARGPTPEAVTALLWTPEAVHVASATVRTDAEGRYAIGGLVPTEHGVTLVDMAGAHSGLFSGDAGLSYARAAVPPAAGVDFEMALATLSVLVTDAGRPLARTEVQATEVRRDGTVMVVGDTAADGRVTWRVRPGGSYVFEIEAPAYEPARAEAKAPSVGLRREVPLALARKGLRASLVVALEPEGSLPLPPVMRCELHGARGNPAVHRIRVDEDRRLHVDDLDPGSFRLVVDPGGERPRDGGYYRAAEASVDLRAGARTTAALRLLPGGRLRVLVRAPAGEAVPRLRFRLETDAGEEVDLAFGKFGERGATISQGSLPLGPGPCDGVDVLAPGPYRLRLTADDGRETVYDVRIEEGLTTELEVLLEEE